VLASLEAGAMETFVPEWFRDLPPVKVGDAEGFLQGAVEYTQSRLDALGRDRPAPPGAGS
jgi:hypothetical protein